jgi:DNA-binding response OmpR family regulator
MRPRALVVDDDAAMRQLLRRHLELEGWSVSEATDGHQAILDAECERFDLIALDVVLRRVDGLAVCRAIRGTDHNADVPILILTAKRSELDKVVGLESGADDYLTKPFGVREFVARVRALHRRTRTEGGRRVLQAQVRVGHLILDPAKSDGLFKGQGVGLTPLEFDLIYLLASQPGVVFTRHALLARVWTSDSPATLRRVDTIVKRIRQKLATKAPETKFILTMWGSGYKCVDPVDARTIRTLGQDHSPA